MGDREYYVEDKYEKVWNRFLRKWSSLKSAQFSDCVLPGPIRSALQKRVFVLAIQNTARDLREITVKVSVWPLRSLGRPRSAPVSSNSFDDIQRATRVSPQCPALLVKWVTWGDPRCMASHREGASVIVREHCGVDPGKLIECTHVVRKVSFELFAKLVSRHGCRFSSDYFFLSGDFFCYNVVLYNLK